MGRRGNPVLLHPCTHMPLRFPLTDHYLQLLTPNSSLLTPNSSLPYGICSKSPSPRNTRVSVKRSFSRRPIAFIKPT